MKILEVGSAVVCQKNQYNFSKNKMDYAIPQKRKSKCDKRAKARYNQYKKGGSQRAVKRKDKQEKKEKKKK